MRSSEVDASLVGDRLVRYHRSTRSALVLNPTATRLWKILDVPRTTDDLVSRASGRVPPVTEERTSADVVARLDELQRKGSPPHRGSRTASKSLHRIGPNADWCARIHALSPGGEAVLPIRPGSLAAELWAPTDDGFGRRRAMPGTLGAIEMPAKTISLGIKPPLQ